MATENILDNIGNIIGTLTFPDGTPQSVFDEALASYAASSPIPLHLADLNTITIAQTANVTTSASTPTILQGMQVTPQAGTYMVQFSGSANTNGASASGTFGVYVNGTLLPETNRPISCNISLLGGLVTISINAIAVGTYSGTQVTLDGNTQLDVRFASTNGGTIGFAERVLTLIKVA